MNRDLQNIPAELRLLRQWVCWRLEKRNCKDTKVPYHPRGSRADTSDPATWSDFAQVAAACANGNRFNGIGFVFAGDYTGVDLDHHRDPNTGELDEFGRQSVERLNSYTEISQSGMGVHVIARGQIPSATGRHDAKRGVEMYSAKRFFVMTGQHVEGTPLTIEARQPEIAAMFREIFPPKNQRQEKAGANTLPLSDNELIERASRARNGDRFSALWRGNVSAYGSKSEADAALLKLLHFWTGGDKERSFRLFAQSGLKREKWEREDYRERTWAAIANGEVYSAKRSAAGAKNSKRDDLQCAIDDPRPKIRLPGCDRLLSDFASELVHVLRDQNIFYRNGEIVTLSDGDLKPLTPQTFRCWAEKFFIGYRAKTIGENSFQFDVTMTDNESRGTLAAPQFTDALRHVHRVNRARLPITGKDGKLTLLPNGYHAETETLTLADVTFDLEMPLNVAVETINDLLVEFCFADGERSKAVAVAGMTGLFGNQLLPEKSLRPCFVLVANAEGAGKTLLAQICITPTLGAMPTGSRADDDDEMRKVILTSVREARAVIFLDNLKGRLSSEPLEGFLSAAVWSGRKLGFNESITGDNLATVFCTGNGMTVSPDMRRRSLFVELHLEAERAEDRTFRRLLDLPTLLEMRAKILAALWALVRHWDKQGRPAPSRGHSAFPSWANVIGGIVEAAGFACPLQTANVTATADPDGEDMRRLVSEMADKLTPCTFGELIELARENGLFEAIIGADGEEPGRREKSAFGKLLGRYDRRLVLNHRFVVVGKGKTRRYKVEIGNGGNGGNGVSDGKTSPYAREFGRKDRADHADDAKPSPTETLI